MTGRWNKVPTTPDTQTYEFDPCTAEVVGPETDVREAVRQLDHARQQLDLTRQYPGRLPANVILMARR